MARCLVDAFPDDRPALFCNTFACKSIQIWRKATLPHSMKRLALFLFCSTPLFAQQKYDLLIKNATVLDARNNVHEVRDGLVFGNHDALDRDLQSVGGESRDLLAWLAGLKL